MTTRKRNPFLGRWRIVEMEKWDQDYIDFIVQGYFEFERDKTGSFHFGTVNGELDYRLETINGQQRLEFSWEGMNDDDPGCGRGWANVQGADLLGRLYIHFGDESWFKAKRQ